MGGITHTIGLAASLLGAIWQGPLWQWHQPSSAMPVVVSAPVTGRMSSRYGLRRHPLVHVMRLHRGIDIAAPRGSVVRATSAGMVTAAGWRGGYGRLVDLDHGYGWRSRYAHLQVTLVEPNQRVALGEIIGLVGATGKVSGPHLHYELHYAGQAIDPVLFLPVDKLSTESLPNSRGFGTMSPCLKWLKCRVSDPSSKTLSQHSSVAPMEVIRSRPPKASFLSPIAH